MATHQEGRVGETPRQKRGKQADAKRSDAAKASAKTAAKAGSKTRRKRGDSEASLKRAPQWKPVYPGSGRLRGKVALITGAGSGIGRAVAVLFAREGADIAIVHLANDADAADTMRMVENAGTIVGS